jgi:hypothetical protein
VNDRTFSYNDSLTIEQRYHAYWKQFARCGGDKARVFTVALYFDTGACFRKVTLLKGSEGKIPAIKILREITDWGLGESKHCIDQIALAGGTYSLNLGNGNSLQITAE